MRKKSVLLLACLFTLLSPRLFAGIAAIHVKALPQETAVLSALDDASHLEPYSRSWTMNWQYPVARDEVAARLSKDLGFLTLASKNHPENAELLLLTGLVARYAYNVDVDGSYDAAMSALGQAQKLAPGDFRAPWFRASLQCQTSELAAGAKEFLAIESSHAWDQLPVAFWEDYINCTTMDVLPAHALRAIDHLEKLHGGEPSDFATAVDFDRGASSPTIRRRPTNQKRYGVQTIPATTSYLPAQYAGPGCGCTATGRSTGWISPTDRAWLFSPRGLIRQPRAPCIPASCCSSSSLR